MLSDFILHPHTILNHSVSGHAAQGPSWSLLREQRHPLGAKLHELSILVEISADVKPVANSIAEAPSVTGLDHQPHNESNDEPDNPTDDAMIDPKMTNQCTTCGGKHQPKNRSHLISF
jgi:hypothetical protein